MSSNRNSTVMESSKHVFDLCNSTVHQSFPIEKVIVHPLVLLSVVDHFSRLNKGGIAKRAVGMLLGSLNNCRTVEILDSFAVPFSEDDSDCSAWFLDMDYLEQMYNLYHKVSAKEAIVGWYHTGPDLHTIDRAIYEQLKRFTPNPVLLIVNPESDGIVSPVKAYVQNATLLINSFALIPSEIAVDEVDEAVVEHLRRDIKHHSPTFLSQRVAAQLMAHKRQQQQLVEIEKYLRNAPNRCGQTITPIIDCVREIQNLLQESTHLGLKECQNIHTNDQMIMIFVGTLMRSVIALHNLVENKIDIFSHVSATESSRSLSFNADNL